MLRLELAQYRELETFAQFGSDLDPATLKQIERGRRLTEILKQNPHDVLAVEKQIVIIYAGTRGYLDKYPVQLCRKYEEELYKFLESKYPDILKNIKEKKDLMPEIEEKLKKALDDFDSYFSSLVKQL
jgi:F-type H+-transporting ATPase subunit alpha